MKIQETNLSNLLVLLAFGCGGATQALHDGDAMGGGGADARGAGGESGGEGSSGAGAASSGSSGGGGSGGSGGSTGGGADAGDAEGESGGGGPADASSADGSTDGQPVEAGRSCPYDAGPPQPGAPCAPFVCDYVCVSACYCLDGGVTCTPLKCH